jgi:hypothetical protein
MNCGHGLPVEKERLRDLVDKMGLERFDAIPDDTKEIAVGTSDADELPEGSGILALGEATISPMMRSVGVEPTAALNTGTRIILPDSVPTEWSPNNRKPYLGARRGTAWHPRTRHTVALIRDKVRNRDGKKIICATYVGHGRTGIKFGIDNMVSTFTQKANSVEENAGDKLSNWAIKNWNKLNINYMIWWNWMNDGAGWFDYEPIRRQWDSGSPNVVASRHLDHVHIQVNSPFIAGNE